MKIWSFASCLRASEAPRSEVLEAFRRPPALGFCFEHTPATDALERRFAALAPRELFCEPPALPGFVKFNDDCGRTAPGPRLQVRSPRRRRWQQEGRT